MPNPCTAAPPAQTCPFTRRTTPLIPTVHTVPFSDLFRWCSAMKNPELGSPSPPVLWARQSEFGSSDHDHKFLFPKLGSPSEIRQILNYELGTNATLQRFLLIWSLSCYWVYMHINTLKQCTIRSYLLSLCNIWHNVLMHIFWKCLGQCSCSSHSKRCQINSLPHIGMQTVSDLCLPHAFASLSYK